MNNFARPGGFQAMPPVVKNLLIINGLFFLGSMLLEDKFRIDLTQILGLYFYKSAHFAPHQLLSHLFMHGNFLHLFSNMFALWMFGSLMENVWGSQRFFVYYFVTGLGAALLHTLVNQYQFSAAAAGVDSEVISQIAKEGRSVLLKNFQYEDPAWAALNNVLNIPTVGASGAVFGVLLAYGMFFPNNVVYVYFAIPIKSKYFVALYGAFELYAGFANNPGDNVAHFAHLGGMLFGYVLIKAWDKKRRY
ncbi:MAG TPA: rhomboid family intramembrane serine protease [Bacteroidia bacterium]|nr:rhomboid family intramembrane serine protease [Bacteroidia bacterium]